MLEAHVHTHLHAIAAPSHEAPIASPVPIETAAAWLDYVTGKDTVEAIAERHGHSVPALRKRAFREQWGAERTTFRERARVNATAFALTTLEEKRAQFQADMHAFCMLGTEALKRGLENLGDDFKPSELHTLVSAGHKLLRTACLNLGVERKAGKRAAPPMAMPEIVPSQAYDMSRFSRADTE